MIPAILSVILGDVTSESKGKKGWSQKTKPKNPHLNHGASKPTALVTCVRAVQLQKGRAIYCHGKTRFVKKIIVENTKMIYNILASTVYVCSINVPGWTNRRQVFMLTCFFGVCILRNVKTQKL